MTKEQEIRNNMTKLGLTREEAEELYECDHDLAENEEQEELQEKASAQKVDVGVVKEKKERKPREIKVSDEKKELFANIYGSLVDNFTDVTVLNENKLIRVRIGEKLFDINLIEKRPPKK